LFLNSMEVLQLNIFLNFLLYDKHIQCKECNAINWVVFII
jgi:hypothetical protein